MSQFATSVRFLLKDGKADEFLHRVKKNPNLGETYSHTVQTGDLTFLWNAIFESEQALIDARPTMIANLDRLRDLLQVISPKLGVTDPVSGRIVFELQS